MKKVLIEIYENQHEMVEKIKSLNCEMEKMTISHFNADPTIISFLIVVTPVIVTQLGKIIKTIISNPSKGRVKMDGFEIEGFTYEETLELLNIAAKKNSEENKTEDTTT